MIEPTCLRPSSGAAMPLTEQYLRGILRLPHPNPAALPPNPPHPFQQSFMFYFRHRFMRHHTPWIFGYGVSIYLFVQIDKAMKDGQRAAYEQAIAEGHVPGVHPPTPPGSATLRPPALATAPVLGRWCTRMGSWWPCLNPRLTLLLPWLAAPQRAPQAPTTEPRDATQHSRRVRGRRFAAALPAAPTACNHFCVSASARVAGAQRAWLGLPARGWLGCVLCKRRPLPTCGALTFVEAAAMLCRCCCGRMAGWRQLCCTWE